MIEQMLLHKVVLALRVGAWNPDVFIQVDTVSKFRQEIRVDSVRNRLREQRVFGGQRSEQDAVNIQYVDLARDGETNCPTSRHRTSRAAVSPRSDWTRSQGASGATVPPHVVYRRNIEDAEVMDSRHPVLPHRQRDPFEWITMCPNLPATPDVPQYSWPSKISPAPTPRLTATGIRLNAVSAGCQQCW